MKTSMSITFKPWYGWFFTARQNDGAKENFQRIPYKIDGVTFYRCSKENKGIISLVSFVLEPKIHGECISFDMDIPEIKTSHIHHKLTNIKKNEGYFLCQENRDNILYIDADKIELVGPSYKKIEKFGSPKHPKPVVGQTNYIIEEHWAWNGGSIKISKYFDYSMYLELLAELNASLRELQYLGGSVMDHTDTAIKLLKNFKKDCQSVLDLYGCPDLDMLVAFLDRRKNKKTNKMEGGEN